MTRKEIELRLIIIEQMMSKLVKNISDFDVEGEKEKKQMQLIAIEQIISQLVKDIQDPKTDEEEKTQQQTNTVVLTEKLLNEIGVDIWLRGYNYLREEILRKIENPNCKLYGNSEGYFKIEHCIRVVKEKVFANRENNELLKKLFWKYNKIPSNKEFIIILANHVKKEMKINNIVEQDDETIIDSKELLIKKLFKDLETDFEIREIEYLVEEIFARVEQPDCKLYWNSVSKFSTAYPKVESAIRRVKTKVFKNIEKSDFLKNLFKKYSCKIPSNKEFIEVLADYVRSENKSKKN